VWRWGLIVGFAIATSIAHAQPVAPVEEAASEWVPLRRGWAAFGIGGDREWYQYEHHFMIDGGVRPSQLPVFVHGQLVKGSNSYEDLGGVSWIQFRLGAEAFGCIDRRRIACGFVTADIGYLVAEVNAGGSESIGGWVFAGRFGIDVGSRLARVRLAFDVTRRPGDHFERTYRDFFDNEVRLHLATIDAIVIAFALQF
jgi:hypothetical protein